MSQGETVTVIDVLTVRKYTCIAMYQIKQVRIVWGFLQMSANMLTTSCYGD